MKLLSNSLLIFCFQFTSVHADPVIFCDVSKGLELINQELYSETQIEKILLDCDKVQPLNTSVLLLHALDARKKAVQDKQYAQAIEWFEKAHKAAPMKENITLELAVTYEMAKDLSKAAQIYHSLLLLNSQNRAALLGQARLFRLKAQWEEAKSVYIALLKISPHDIDALNGLAWVKASEKDLISAHYYFQNSLKIQPENKEAKLGIKEIEQTEGQIQGIKNRVAQFGLARAYRMRSEWDKAGLIYHQFLIKNPKDVDALNGLGWVELAKSHFDLSSQLFLDSLKIQPFNEEAKLALKTVAEAKLHPAAAPLSQAERGLMLLNKKNPPLAEIQKLLRYADKHEPLTLSTLMLHGLLARYLKDYKTAIIWLKQAMRVAKLNKDMAALELAVTYEWTGDLPGALALYQAILFNKPTNRPALLGKARVLRASYKIPQSKAIYLQVLQKSPKDVEALNGYGETLLANYEFKQARTVLSSALALSPQNKQTTSDLKILNKATKNILELTQGHYVVPPNTADGLNLFYFRHLNATDGLTVFATHNNRQIQSGFGSGPTLLPNNSLLLGYQRIIPKKYSWQVSYDARQHDALPFENRAFGMASLFLNSNLEWFNGVRLIEPKPWYTALIISGLTAYTPWLANITVTGFWTEQQIGGYSSSYVLDFSKEFSNSFFYDLGASYLPQQNHSYELHGKLIVPVFGNQALVGQVSHYFFNNSSFITAGWRIYWA